MPASDQANTTNIVDEALIASIGDGLIAIDKDNKIIRASDKAQEMLGYGKKDIVGKLWSEAIKLENEQGQPVLYENRPIKIALETGKVIYSDKYFFITPGGYKFRVGVTASPIVYEGKTQGALCVFRDITTEKDIDRAKSEFVSLASHQLRTPLSAINWYAEMLLKGRGGELNEKHREFVKQIFESNQRMIALVNSLLDVSRIELGTFAVEPEPVNLREVMESVLAEIQAQISAKQHNIKQVYDTKLPIYNADPKLVRIIFQNLITNAVKYTHDRGNIKISLELTDSKDVLLTVADNGYGIPKEQSSHIFGKLFRADNIRVIETDGTGLGLYIIKSIVDQSHGKIWFDSEENKGTTFYVLLPKEGMNKKIGTKTL